MTRTKAAAGLALLLLALPASAAGATAREQITRISLAGKAVTGAHESVRGRVVIRTPRATFRRTNHDASPSARFSANVTGSCTAHATVSARAIVSRVGPVTQTLASTRLADAVALGSGSRDGAAWRLVEYTNVDPETRVRTGETRLYGLAAMRLRPRRWLQMRTFVTFRRTCTMQDRRTPSFVAALERMLRTARVEADIVRG